MKARFGRLHVLAMALFLASPAILSAEPPSYVPGEVLVRYKPGVVGLERAKVRAQMKGKVLRSWDDLQAERIQLDDKDVEKAIRHMQNHPQIRTIEPNYIVHATGVPNDPLFPQQWSLQNTGQSGGIPLADIRAVPAWDITTGDQNLKIGVIDTGIDFNHPDLVENIWTNPGEIPDNYIDDDGNGYPDDVHGFNFADEYTPGGPPGSPWIPIPSGDPDGWEFVPPMDNHGHGTHVAGTIAGRGNNGIGVAGVAWKARLVAIKFLDSHGAGTVSSAIDAIFYSKVVGCRLTNNSWRYYSIEPGASQVLYQAIDFACGTYGTPGGALFIAAAGNETSDNDGGSPAYPASYNLARIISVAATNQSDQLASFSNYGATTVDLAAPGVAILSTGPGNVYFLLQGTSMATPHVTGVTALICNSGRIFMNADAVKTRLLATVDVLQSLQGKVLTNGRVNAFKAVTGNTDGSAPAAVGNLVAGLEHTTGVATWTAPGDDISTGTAAAFDLRISTAAITSSNFYGATQVSTVAPGPPGTSHCADLGVLVPCTTYYIAIKTRDEAYNWSPMSNLASATTTCSGSLEVSCDSYLTAQPDLAMGESEPNHVEDPHAVSFVLYGASPNPARASAQLNVSFSLPDSRPASLALYNVAGRRVAGREVGSLGVGRHIVGLPRERLAAGVYVLRLTRGEESFQKRVVLMP